MAKAEKKVEFGGLPWADMLKKYVGQKVAVLCVRYQYRGTCAEVGDNYLTLVDAAAVERSGSSSLQQPEVEDPCGCPVHIKFDAIEIVHQPTWVNAPLRAARAS